MGPREIAKQYYWITVKIISIEKFVINILLNNSTQTVWEQKLIQFVIKKCKCSFVVLSLTSRYLTTQLNQDQLKENVPKNTQLSNRAMNLHQYPDSILVSWTVCTSQIVFLTPLGWIQSKRFQPPPPPPIPRFLEEHAPWPTYITTILVLRDLQNSIAIIIFLYNTMWILSFRPGDKNKENCSPMILTS